MENNTNPILETPIINQPEFVLPPPKKNYLTITLISLVFILFITCIYLLFKQSSAVTPDSALQTPTKAPVAVLPQTTPVPTVTTETTVNWKIYKNSLGYQISYPQNWTVETPSQGYALNTSQAFTLKQGENKIKFDFPDDFGPGTCIFSDDPNFSVPGGEMWEGSKCPGKYIEINNSQFKIRRLDLPNSSTSEWSIYIKDKAGVYTANPVINYNISTNSDKKIILLMDQILSTFKFTESRAETTVLNSYSNPGFKFSLQYPSSIVMEVNQNRADNIQLIFNRLGPDSFNISASKNYPVNQPKYIFDTTSTGTRNIGNQIWSYFALPNNVTGLQVEEGSILYKVIYPLVSESEAMQILTNFKFTK